MCVQNTKPRFLIEKFTTREREGKYFELFILCCMLLKSSNWLTFVSEENAGIIAIP